MAGEHVDLSSESPRNVPVKAHRKPFVGIRFNCCGVYSRIYLNAEKTAFIGHCPRCAKAVHLEISPTGSDQRIFNAY